MRKAYRFGNAYDLVGEYEILGNASFIFCSIIIGLRKTLILVINYIWVSNCRVSFYVWLKWRGIFIGHYMFSYAWDWKSDFYFPHSMLLPNWTLYGCWALGGRVWLSWKMWIWMNLEWIYVSTCDWDGFNYFWSSYT